MSLAVKLNPISSAKFGDLKWWVGSVDATLTTAVTPLPNWLVCNGASLDRTVYANLFGAIGTTFGSVDGTHFTIPDFRDGRNPLAAGPTHFPTVGAVGGEYTHALTVAEMPSHSHNYFDGFANDPSWNNPGTYVLWDGYNPGQNPPVTNTGTSGGVNGGKPNGANGDGHENMPPVQVVGCMLIRY